MRIKFLLLEKLKMKLNQISYIKNYIKKIVFTHKNLYYIYIFLKHIKYNIFSLHLHHYPIIDIVVCGMPRSGSTLLFNILREIVRIDLDKSDGFFTTDKQYALVIKSERSYIVKKTHNLSWIIIKRIKKKKSIGFFTHRDIRDIFVSMMQIGWIKDFKTFLNYHLPRIINIALIYAGVKNMHIYSYEQLINNKIEILKNLQTILNIKLDENSIAKILKKTSIDETNKKVSKLAKNQEYDPSSHIHRNHIRDAKIGKWKDKLTEYQIKLINLRTKKYLTYFNYDD